MTPATRNLFALAENLGMTVTYIKRAMPLSEYMDWLRFYNMNNDEDAQPDTTSDDLKRAFNIG